MATFRVHVIEKQWGGFEADFWTYADGENAAEAMAAVEARCSAWRADQAEPFGLQATAEPVSLAEDLQALGQVSEGGCVLQRVADRYIMFTTRNVLNRHSLAVSATSYERLEAHWRGFVDGNK
ncbi:TPA: hypothetical protein ACYSGT_006212 [Pseudomonas aeruginosa]